LFDILNKNFNDNEISAHGQTITFKEIEEYMLDIAPDFFVEDLTKCSQNTFKGICRATGVKFFRHSNILINYTGENGPLHNVPTSYNMALLCGPCLNFYYQITEKFNKIKNLQTFLLLFGMDLNNLDRLTATPEGVNLVKNLQYNRQDSLKDKLIDSKNIVGTLAVFNDENGRTVQGYDRKTSNQELINSINQNNVAQIEVK
jgi:hypothetical protein